MQEGAPSASNLLDDYHCPLPFAFGDFDGAQQLRFVKMYKVAGTSFQFQLQNAARRRSLSTFELPTSGALEGPRAIPDMVLGHQRYGVDHNRERSSVVAVDAAFPEWRHNKSITYVTNLRHPVERAKAFVFWTRYLDSWQNKSTGQEDELRAEVDELSRNLTHSAGNIAGECRRMHTISFLCGKHCDELFDPFDGKLARPDAVELALEQAKRALVRDVRVVGMMASAQRDTLSILAHMMDDMSVLSSPDKENLHAYSEVHWGWGDQKETYDYPGLTAEELDATANACGPEMELYNFAIRLHRRQLQCAREARNISSADTHTVQALQHSETNMTAEADTASEAPLLAGASEGGQRPWWERLSEKHRELRKRQSWLQQHRVALEASSGGAHARFTTLAPQPLAEPIPRMAAAHRACEACLLRSVRHQPLLHVTCTCPRCCATLPQATCSPCSQAAALCDTLCEAANRNGHTQEGGYSWVNALSR